MTSNMDQEKLPGLVCVEYPGVVEDPVKMVETLGGLDTLAQVLEEPNRRLELRFRPDDVFCKPTCGEKTSASSFLLRVKRKKLKQGREDAKKPPVIHTSEVVGAVSDCYQFNNLCDFQYLCMSNTDTGHESIYHHVYTGDRLVDTSWFDQKAPLFTPPAAFSRMDIAQDYQFRRETSSSQLTTPHNIIGRTRHRRSHHAIFVTYDVEKVPDKPRDVALNQIKLKFIDQDRLALVKDKFDKRPVWSKNALTALTGIPADRLKLILPAYSYYFTNGPWRNQWIRFGYDPRTTPTAAPHQTLDYRVRLQGGARNKVAAKRSYANYLLPYKAMNWSKPRTSLISKDSFSTGAKEEQSRVNQTQENEYDLYLFREGSIPPYRQMFYQYGDIELPAAQAILSSSRVSDVCDEKSGWYPAGTEDQLREVLTASINRQLAVSREGEMEVSQEELELDVSQDLSQDESQ